MSIKSQLISYEHEVTWTIEKFKFLCSNGNPIPSPKFEVKCLDVLPMSFMLHTKDRKKDDFVKFAVSLHSNADDKVFKNIRCIRYVVSIIGTDCKSYFITQGSFAPEFPSPPLLVVEIVNSLIDERYLQKESLVVTCKLTISANHEKYLSSLYNKRLTSLSNALWEMHRNQIRCDMLVYSREKKEFGVHKCILRARCPVLFNLPNFVDSKPKPIWYSNMSKQSIKTLLYYIYGADIIKIPIDVKSDLIDAAILYQLPDLKRKLQEYPVSLNITTKITVVKNELRRQLRKMINNKGEQLKPIRCQLKLKMSQYRVSFKVLKRKFPKKYFVPHFKYINAKEDTMLLNCTLRLEGKRQKTHKKVEYTFPYAKDGEIPCFLTKREMIHRRLNSAELEFEVHVGEISFEVLEGPVKEPPSSSSIFNDVSLIGSDLNLIYENQVDCDLKIKVGQQIFLGHRSFLESSNKIIKEKLKDLENKHQENDTSMMTITLDGIKPYICGVFLKYLYSGRVDLNNSQIASDFRDAVSYFSLPKTLFPELFGFISAKF